MRILPQLSKLNVNQFATGVGKGCGHLRGCALHNHAFHRGVLDYMGIFFTALKRYALQVRAIFWFQFLNGIAGVNGDAGDGYGVLIPHIDRIGFYDGIARSQALPADITEGHLKFIDARRGIIPCDLLFGYQPAGFYLVDVLHLQAGQRIIALIRVAVGAENDGVGIGWLRAAILIIAFLCSLLFRSAIIGARLVYCCDLLFQRFARFFNRHSTSTAIHRGNRLPVLVHCPCGVIQFCIQYLLERNVTAAAELIVECNYFAVFQYKPSLIVYHLHAIKVRGVLCVCGVFQRAGCGGAVIRDFILLGSEAGLYIRYRFGNKGKVSEIDVALIVIAHADGCNIVVKTNHLFHLIQAQLYRVPLIGFQRNRAECGAVQTCFAKAAHLPVAIIQQLQVQVVEGKVRLSLDINLECEVAVLIEVNRIIQLQDTIPHIAGSAAQVIMARKPVQNLTGIGF